MTGEDFFVATKDMWRWNGDYMVTNGFDKDVTIKLSDGTEKTIPAAEIKHLAREDKADMDPGVFHVTMKQWLAEGRGAAMDKDAGSHVWNYNFSKFETTERKVENFNREEATGYHGKAGDGEIRHYNASVTFDSGDQLLVLARVQRRRHRQRRLERGQPRLHVAPFSVRKLERAQRAKSLREPRARQRDLRRQHRPRRRGDASREQRLGLSQIAERITEPQRSVIFTGGESRLLDAITDHGIENL